MLISQHIQAEVVTEQIHQNKTAPNLKKPEELIELLTVSEKKAKTAAAELTALGIQAIPTLIKHINDTRKSYYDPTQNMEMECLGKCKETVRDVCFYALLENVENNVPKGCRYFQFQQDTHELIAWLNEQSYDSLEGLRLAAAKYIQEKTKNDEYASCISFWGNRIKELQALPSQKMKKEN